MKKIFLYAFSLCLLVTSCDSFLDTENLTKKDSSNFPKTEADIQSALTSIYDELRHATDGEEWSDYRRDRIRELAQRLLTKEQA